jgi:hypothetical protein
VSNREGPRRTARRYLGGGYRSPSRSDECVSAVDRQTPWMKTTGVLPEALAASISRFSRSEIDAIPELPSVAVVSQATLAASASLKAGSKLRKPSVPNLPAPARSTVLLLRHGVGHRPSDIAPATARARLRVPRGP